MKLPGALAIFCLFGARLFAVDPVYRPLWLYYGSWTATKQTLSGPSTSQTIVNDCAMAGRFFACQQTVDGKPGALIVFVPASTPGDYYTQAVLQEGWAAGRGQLHIEGDRWTYSSKAQEEGKTTYHRTTNVFSGKDRIHFEISESADEKNWTVTASGDEVRTAKGKH
jgi:hypothetical protein